MSTNTPTTTSTIRLTAAEIRSAVGEKLKAAEEAAAAGKSVMAAEAEDAMPPVIATSTFRGHLTVLVVGAGGNGARVVPPLTQMLRRGDHLFVADHDIVEDRNLIRQHFTARDIGAPKAVVLAERYRREGIRTTALQTQLQKAEVVPFLRNLNTVAQGRNLDGRGGNAFVVIGCVDNAEARVAIAQLIAQAPSNFTGSAFAWIDVGNETRGGQVILTTPAWPMKVTVKGQRGEPGTYSIRGMEAMPQLLRPAPSETASCGERIDMQTVQVNAMAASAVINTLSWLMLGLPFTSCGTFFSTLNTMQPIRMAGTRGYVINPEDKYAIPA